MRRFTTAIKTTSRRIATIARLLWNLPTYIDRLENLRIVSGSIIDQLDDVEMAFGEFVTQDALESRFEEAIGNAVREELENCDIDQQIEDWVTNHMDYEAVAECVVGELDTDEIVKQVLQALSSKMRDAAREMV